MKNTNRAGLRAPAGLTTLALAAAVALGSLAAPAQAAASGKPLYMSDPRVADLGVASPTAVQTFSISLALRNQAALEAYAASIADPKSPNFRKFLTPEQFTATYGQTADAVAKVVSYLQSQGFTINKVFSNNLLVNVSATNAQIAAVFGAPIHAYSTNGTTFQAPSANLTLPSALSGVVSSVTGLNNSRALRSHAVHLPNAGALAGDAPKTNLTVLPVGNPTGTWTTNDLAAKYDVNPLYAKGITGAGATVGIVTLAGYNQSDAYTYWSQIGLTVNPSRITDVPVDGGPLAADGPGSDGSGETTLDVEQSGGVAPGADMRVYLAPNTDSGFIDAFTTVVTENKVDVLSVSWGSPEVFYEGPGDSRPAFHAAFLQAVTQGIPVIAAAGDEGADDITRSYPYPYCTTLLTVDYPAADPLVLAAGGTTLPNTFVHKYATTTETAERAWAWDYMRNYIVTYYGNALYYADYATVGGGGGVSVDEARPAWQTGVAGMQSSAAGQSLLCSAAVLGLTGTGYYDLLDMPRGVAGRNLPDVSLNADPYSGYAVYQGGWGNTSGGTSFVAPQLNGILALITAGAGTRLGSINPQLYAAFKAHGYAAGSPFKAITAGTNAYYKSTASYNPATGLGSLDVAALATALGVK